MVRGAYVHDRCGRSQRYVAEITPTKRHMTQMAAKRHAVILLKHLGRYSLAAMTPEIIARFRDIRLAGEDRKDKQGKPLPRANNMVRLDLALLGHLFTVAIKEWGVGLPSDPSIEHPQAYSWTGAQSSSVSRRRDTLTCRCG